jgi:hypothetical protein
MGGKGNQMWGCGMLSGQGLRWSQHDVGGERKKKKEEEDSRYAFWKYHIFNSSQFNMVETSLFLFLSIHAANLQAAKSHCCTQIAHYYGSLLIARSPGSRSQLLRRICYSMRTRPIFLYFNGEIWFKNGIRAQARHSICADADVILWN